MHRRLRKCWRHFQQWWCIQQSTMNPIQHLHSKQKQHVSGRSMLDCWVHQQLGGRTGGSHKHAATITLDNSTLLKKLENQQRTMLDQQAKLMALLTQKDMVPSSPSPTNATSAIEQETWNLLSAPVSVTPAKRTSATMKMRIALHSRRTKTSDLHGTNWKCRMQWGPVVYQVMCP